MPDPRFARLRTDPRFRRPRLKHTKVVIDDRFKSVFEQAKKKRGPKVDKYGRPTSGAQEQEDLRRYYRLETKDGKLEDNDTDAASSRIPDLARGEVLLESSDEEEDNQLKASDDDSDDGGFVTLGGDPSYPIPIRDEDIEVDLNEDTYADLEAQATSYSNTYPEDEAEQITTTTRTSRLAIVNLDWDHVRAHHLYKICSSLVSSNAPAFRASSSTVLEDIYERKKGSSKGSAGGPVNVVQGKVLSVRVYPSDFGKTRMAKEEKDGPPAEIFKARDLDEREINEKTVYEVGGEEQYDEDALRKYQLERLRYYYAIVECDTVDAASHIYNELDGTELERSANVFDMSFVPADMTFDNEPRDEVTNDLNTEYKPVEFVTDALRHSKVKLTWDDDDPERHQVTRRALTKTEIEENDFSAYIANTSSESEDDDVKKKNKKASRDKLRSLLLGGNEDKIPEGWGDDNDDDDVDMEITFTPALSKKSGEETTLERYQRKRKEKRTKRKEELREKYKENKEKSDDEFFEAGEDEEDGGDDVNSTSKSRNIEKGPTRKEKAPSNTRKEVTADELALLVAPDSPTKEPKHFNLKSVVKAEKQKKSKKKRKKGKVEEDNEAQEDFVMNVKDERFKVLFEDHQFAIDPTNPHFKKTKAMSALLEERQKRRREQVQGVEEVASRPKVDGAKSLQNLIESVKRKSANIDLPGQGKRQKL